MSASSPSPARSLTLLVASLLVPTGVSAQSPSILSLLPTEGRVLEPGAEQTGALSASDHLSTDDSFLEAWELAGRPGQSVTVDLVSDDFDAMLYVVGPGLGETLRDDDSGGGCNARITFTFLESGTFRVVAAALGTRETGTYTLRVSEQPEPGPQYACGEADPAALMALPVGGRTLRMGAVETGQLGPFHPTVQEGRPAEAWLLEARAGEALSIVMESGAFDSYLYLVGPGLEAVLSDDDGAGELNSQIEVRLPTDGPYVVVASTISSEPSGPYTLRVGEPLDLAAVDTEGRAVDLGQAVDGSLGFTDPVLVDGRRGQAWALDLAAGQSVSVELISDDFDAYLYLAGPGLPEPMQDDDGAGDLNSRIALVAPATGTYRVIVSGLSTDASGAFTLRVAPM